MAVNESKHHWQHIDRETGSVTTITDKLIGLEVHVLNVCCDANDGDPTIVIDPEDVPSLIRALIRFVTTGSQSIAREVREETTP